MALTQNQKDAIRRQAKKNAQKRAALQRTKISDKEARSVSHELHKRPGAKPGFSLKDTNLLSKSELDTLGRTSKANAQREQKMQKQRKFAKGEGKLPIKERVGTKAEYKQLGKDIQTRTKLIAYGKAARAAQAERAANPAPAKKATLSKATPTKAATPVAKKTTSKAKPTPKVTPKPTVKESTAAIKKRTFPNTNAKPTLTPTTKKQSTPKPKPMAKPTPKTKTKPKATFKRPMVGPMGVGTSSEYKALAEEKKTRAALTKKSGEIAKGKTISGKVAKKVSTAKTSIANTKVGTTAKKISKTTLAKDVTKGVAKGSQGIAAKAKKVGGSKLLKYAKKAGRAGQFLYLANYTKDVVTGEETKNINRIRVLENRLAAAKGLPPKHKNVYDKGLSNEIAKQDLANAAKVLSSGLIGKSRKDRIAELRVMVKKAEANPVVKTGGKSIGKKVSPPSAYGNTQTSKGTKKTPAAPSTYGNTGGTKTGTTPTKTTSGNKYRVVTGDTLSGIAARAGVSLADLRSANPQIKDPRKIYRNTGVVIPKGGKVPTGGYVKKVK